MDRTEPTARDEVDADILGMDQEDLVDEIMALRLALKTLGAELLPDGSLSIGAKTFAVVDGIRLTKE